MAIILGVFVFVFSIHSLILPAASIRSENSKILRAPTAAKDICQALMSLACSLVIEWVSPPPFSLFPFFPPSYLPWRRRKYCCRWPHVFGSPHWAVFLGGRNGGRPFRFPPILLSLELHSDLPLCVPSGLRWYRPYGLGTYHFFPFFTRKVQGICGI